MAFSSVHEMIDLCKESGKPLYEVILESDLAESGLTRAESEAEMHRLWAVMQATSDGYCGADRSMSGFAGGDAAKVNAAAARGVLYADGYFADVMAEALKTAECNACMKRIVAAPTAGSCGVLPAVLLPLQRRGLADEAAVHRALYIAAGFGQVVAARATLAGAEGGCQAEVGAASGMAAAALVDIKGGEWAIIHRCRLCGKLTSNRIAADDNPMLLMSIAMRPLCTPPFPLERIEEMTALMGGEGRMR